MKKTILGLAALALMASCKTGGDTVDLKFQLPEGKTFRYTTDMQQTIEQTMMGNAMTTKQNMLFETLYKTTGTSGDSRTVEVSYDRMKMETSAMDQVMKFDSRDTAGNNPMLASIGGMVGKKFMMTVLPSGKITKVDGFADIINGMVASADPATAGAMRQQMEQMFSDSSVRQMLSQTTEFYPEKPVKVGETWTRTNTVGTGPITMTVNNTYKLESATDKKATVSVNSTISGKGAEGAGAVEGMKVDMTGKQTGKMEIEIATGLLENSSINQDVTGTIEVQGMKIPMKLNTVGTVKGAQVN